MAESLREDIAKLESRYRADPAGRVFTHLADAYRRAGDPLRARAVLDQGLRLHPDSASGYIVLGRLLEDAAEPEEAEAAYTHALALDPENRVALRALGDIARATGRHEEAIAHYRRLHAVDPSDEEAAALVAPPESPAPAPQNAPVAEIEPAEVAAEATPTEAVAEVEPAEVAAEAAADFAADEVEPAEVAAEAAADFAADEVAPEIEAADVAASVVEPVEIAAQLTPQATLAAPEQPHPGWDGLAVLMTETMGDLFRAQGHLDRAAGVYRELLRDRPGDENLQGKLREVEGALVAAAASRQPSGGEAAPAAPERMAAMEAVWSEGGAVPAGEPTPYAWEGQPEEETGRPVGEYLRSLLGWRRTRTPAEAPFVAMDAVPPAPERMDEGAAYEYGRAADVEPPPFDAAAIAEGAAGELSLPVAAEDGAAGQPPYEPSAAEVMVATGAMPEEPAEPAEPLAEAEVVEEAVAEVIVVEPDVEELAPPVTWTEGEPLAEPPFAEALGPEAPTVEALIIEAAPEEMAPADVTAEPAPEPATEPPAAVEPPAEVAPEPISEAAASAEPVAELAEPEPEPPAEVALVGEMPEAVVAEPPAAEVAPEAEPRAGSEADARELESAPEPPMLEVPPVSEPELSDEIALGPEPPEIAPEPPSAEVALEVASLEAPPEQPMLEAAPVSGPELSDEIALEPEPPEIAPEPPLAEVALEAASLEAPPEQPEPVAPPAPRGTGPVVVNPWKTPPATGPIWDEEASEDDESEAQRHVVWKLDPKEAAKEEGASVPRSGAGTTRTPDRPGAAKKGEAESKRDDDDLGMFRAWLQSLRK